MSDPQWILEDRVPVKFKTHTPCGQDVVQSNVWHALNLGIPEADYEPIRTLHVIANGPSAAQFDFDALKNGAPIKTLALNGALKLFTDRGLAPTWWAACDSQDFVRDFVKVAPNATTYLVASRCHPNLFDALKERQIRLWHVEEDDIQIPAQCVPRGTSITLCALSLMRRLGYRNFEIHGWDGCYDGLKHHASDAPLADLPEDTVTITLARDVDGTLVELKKFTTRTCWAVEAQEAVNQLQFADYSYTIHGPGMIAEMVRSHVTRGLTCSPSP